MDFVFYLKVLKNRFKCTEEHSNLNITLSDVGFTLKKETESAISILTTEVNLCITSSTCLLNNCNTDFFENHINLANQTRVVVMSDITYSVAGSAHLSAIFELLFIYFHVILIKESELPFDPHVEEKALLLEKVILNKDTYLCYCDPDTVV